MWRRITPPLAAALLLACTPGESVHGTPAPPILALSSPGGVRPLTPLRGGHQVHVAPLVSRSERVPRLARTRRGLGLVLEGGSTGVTVTELGLRAVQHGADHQILSLGGVPSQVGPALLPAQVSADHGDLAWLARQDGNRVQGGTITLTAPDLGFLPHSLILLGGNAQGTGLPIEVNGVAAQLPGGSREALAFPAHSGETVAVHLAAAAMDQAFYAQTETLGAEEGVSLGLLTWERSGSGAGRSEGDDSPWPTHIEAGESLEVWFAPPSRAQPGRTWTVLVEFEVTGLPDEVPGLPAEPATSPGFLPDVSAQLGLAHVHFEGPDEQLDISPTMGPGVAWGDVDGDGWVDLYLVQGSGREGTAALSNRLMRNVGGTRFEDITATSGTGDRGAGMGALFFDADGDGDLDLYVANRGRDVLYANDGSGSFTDVSESAGLTLDLWSAGVAAADSDGDGDLDLYITSYLDFDLAKMERGPDVRDHQREDPLAMLPFAFPGARNVFLRNEGGLVFRDVTEELGLEDGQGRGMQAVFWDFDRDGDSDLYVANDVSFNVLFRNEGNGTFEDISYATGVDDPRGGMGLAVADVDGDLDEDLFLTNWQLEANALYLSNLFSPFETKHRRSSFHDATVSAGLVGSIGYTSWGAVLFDLECDGDMDLFVANGYTSPDYEGTGICVGQPNHLYANDGEGHFTDVSADAGGDLLAHLPSRAAVGCDFDRDGDVDLVVTSNNARLQLLRNDAPRKGRWLGLHLRGASGNRFGVGAEVTVRAGARAWRRSLGAGTSYLGGNPPELHLGLGQVGDQVDVTVRWPSGKESTHRVPVDGWRKLVEPE